MRGGQWQVLYLLRGLRDAGHRATLLAPAGSPLFEAARAVDLDAQPLRRFTLSRYCKAAGVVHAHDARAHTLAALTSKPLVVSRRVGFAVRGSVLSRWKYARPRLYLAVSNYVRGMLLAAGIADEKIVVVYDGVALGPEPEYSGRSNVIALDSTDPRKGRVLLEKAARLAGVHVHFSDNLARDLVGARLFIYISDLEGLGSAALVAMADGVPVLASRVGGLPEIVENGCTGVLTDNSPEQISTAMARLLSDPEFLVYLGRRGRARVEERFTISHMVQHTIAAYQKVLG